MASPSTLPLAAEELKAEGNKYFGSGDFVNAADAYKRAIGVCPESAVLWSNLAAAHVNLKQWGEALQAAGECLKLDPGFIKAYGRKAAAQLGLIRPGDAECTLRAGLAVDPHNGFLQEELERLRKEDDGDQRPVRGMNGSDRPLRDMQGRTGLSMEGSPPWPSPAFKHGYSGDFEAFSRAFQPADLQLRALEARLPLVAVVISGAQRQRGADGQIPDRTASDAERGTQHRRCLQLLLDAGCRVDGKDAAGWTALHHATAHHTVLDLAQMLLDAGADPNLQDRYGTYPLVSAVMNAQVQSVKLLLAAGARADLKDNDGCTALQVCRFHPEIQALIHGAHFSNVRPGGGKKKACANCGKSGAKKACTGCSGGVHYCNRACQQEHWKAHKHECGSLKAQAAAATYTSAPPFPFPPGAVPGDAGAEAGAAAAGAGAGAAADVDIGDLPRELRIPLFEPEADTVLINNQAYLASMLSNLMMTDVSKAPISPEEATRRATLTATKHQRRQALTTAAAAMTREHAAKVKVQVHKPMNAQEVAASLASGSKPEALLVYNADRSLVCYLDGETPAGGQLMQLIRARGILGPGGGKKAYFACYFDDKCARNAEGVPTEMVVATSMLPMQPF
ncbi:hypothetical protein CHLRE_03g151100v5 [Chlamydomonas reinhardtii]|uniref:MYND-type domain-containing protein n=1 Tax=Chlamydomonas reinhardtii TaxID=3055 RepID=A0A2K3DVP9_CHLRE|nr:uncharacterized protein CHLRE_03g151100v5 [Chlamydomonas reinhardtii]PNW84608.1 hypothetical protein CHLRE_03g151100v5 [Chlamydomonas reinhardtii]